MTILSERNRNRVCVVGLDGVPHSLLTRFAADGTMPCVAALLEEGKLSQMRVSIPEISAVSWTSFATGSNPGVHGIFGFVDLKPNSYELRFPNFLECRARTVWERIGADGGRSIVINQPFTYPARPMAGSLVAGFVALDLERGTHPAELIPRLQQIGYRIDIDTARCREDYDLLWRELVEILAARRRAVDMLWAGEWDYFQVVVTGTDRLHHYLWDAVVDEGHPHHKTAVDYYRQVDGFVCDVWERFREQEGEGAIERFLLLSDHGFTAIEQEVYLNRWLQQEGYLSLPAGAKSLEGIDEGSYAFCIDPGRIIINRKSRFPRGHVAESDVPFLVEEIKGKLEELEYDSKPVMRKVFAREEIYHGPMASKGPDLVALSRHGFDLKGSPGAESVFGRSNLTGMHTWDDAFVLTGLDLEQPVFIWDLAKVILSKMGIKR